MARIERGLGVLTMLDEGRVQFDGANWQVTGIAPDKAVETVVGQVLASDSDPAWQLNLKNADDIAKAEEQARLEAEAKAKAEAEEQARLELRRKPKPKNKHYLRLRQKPKLKLKNKHG